MKRVKKQKFSFKLTFVVAIVLIAIVALIVSVSAPKKSDAPITERTLEKSSDLFYDYEITRYPSTVEVVELRAEKTMIGFDVDPDRMNFGAVPANGSYARKVINLTNTNVRDVKISVLAEGDVAPFTEFSKNNFILRKTENSEIEVFFNTMNGGNDARIGNYTGEISVMIQIPKYSFIYKFWGV